MVEIGDGRTRLTARRLEERDGQQYAVYSQGSKYQPEIWVPYDGDDVEEVPEVFTLPMPEYRRRRDNGTDPRHHFPSLSYSEGAFSMDIGDLVDVVLERAPPEEVALGLWAHKAVREAFIQCAINTYTTGALDDPDRVKLINGLKQTIHDYDQRRLADALQTAEYKMREIAYGQSARAEFRLLIQNFMDQMRTKFPEAWHWMEYDFKIGQHAQEWEGIKKDFARGNNSWNDVRDYWREQLLKAFPKPEDVLNIVDETIPF